MRVSIGLLGARIAVAVVHHLRFTIPDLQAVVLAPPAPILGGKPLNRRVKWDRLIEGIAGSHNLLSLRQRYF